MLVEAKLTKEIQERVNENYREYKKLEEHISEKIFFAASIGSDCCEYSTLYSQKYENNLRIIANKLQELGYTVELLIAPKTLTLSIKW